MKQAIAPYRGKLCKSEGGRSMLVCMAQALMQKAWKLLCCLQCGLTSAILKKVQRSAIPQRRPHLIFITRYFPLPKKPKILHLILKRI